jgi:integrase
MSSRGSITQRSPGSWSLVYDAGYRVDPVTGAKKRIQKWRTVRGSKKQAQKALTEILRDLDRGEYVERSSLTLGAWLTEWLDRSIKPSKRPSTVRKYTDIIENSISSTLKAKPVQQVTALDLEAFYVDRLAAGYSPSTISGYHTVLHSALKSAASPRVSLVQRNVAALVEGKPKPDRNPEQVEGNCWDEDEARRFLAAAKAAGRRQAAFYALALDAGLRKGELCGLQWRDLDLEKGTVSIIRQLLKTGAEPVYGPIKNDMPRTIELSAGTIELLKTHKKHQAEMKMANRQLYRDHGLVFTKEWKERGTNGFLGLPLQANNLAERDMLPIIKKAGVRRINVHGLRHTCATLLLKSGEPAHVVQRRLGHKRIEQTLSTYAHVLPSMQQATAAKMGALLHG